ncbi:condensation protein [Streptomyces sp. NBC_00237]|uniref:condensation protein n=1 Tax=Streptomyces sp. NBC_00237 TaxID=2975687 RepID=UPI00224EE8E9|nr:condensation protein [Streptomyces sp. NBC_00237]MCX5203300.1 condensation protein [Streptomyces sp. NBC_00237]
MPPSSAPPHHPTTPFTVVDEITRHCLDPAEPETVHIEVHLPSAPDPARLRTAFLEALRRHPRILMREAPGPWYRRRYEWQLTPHPDTEGTVVQHHDTSDRALAEARARALTHAPPLSLSPPVRLEIIGRVLLVVLNHTALDGPACLRVLATTAELYGGRDNSPVSATGPARPGHNPRYPIPGTGFAPVARVAAGTAPGAPGNGLLVADLPVPRRPRGAPYTVNDQLMVATARMIAEWNTERRSAPRPMRVTMPVDDRPRGMDMPIGNGTRLVEVPFTHEELTDSDTAELLLRTADRTRALKALSRPQLGHGAALLTAPVVPVTVRAALIRQLRRTVGPWTSTTLLSNIGRVPYPLDFGDGAGRARAVWFSAPARMPRGLTVTTASTAGRLHLALRWSGTLLGPRDGEHLRELFEKHLHTTAALDDDPVDTTGDNPQNDLDNPSDEEASPP